MMMNKRSTPGFPQQGAFPSMQQPPTQEQAKALLTQQVSQISQGIYTRSAAQMLARDLPTVEVFESLARYSHLAAKAYFSGLLASAQQEAEEAAER